MRASVHPEGETVIAGVPRSHMCVVVAGAGEHVGVAAYREGVHRPARPRDRAAVAPPRPRARPHLLLHVPRHHHHLARHLLPQGAARHVDSGPVVSERRTCLREEYLRWLLHLLSYGLICKVNCPRRLAPKAWTLIQ